MKLRLPQKRWKKIVVISFPVMVLLAVVGMFLLNYFSNMEPSFSQNASSSPLVVTSSAFGNGVSIPIKYTGDGENINPPLQIYEIPESTVSVVLIVDDPAFPLMTWNHWLVWNIPVINGTVSIDEASTIGIQGKNSWRTNIYGGPDPPFGTHNYYFKAYALNINLDLNSDQGKSAVLSAMNNHVLAKGELVGAYP